jgi:hypothetical protein
VEAMVAKAALTICVIELVIRGASV